MVLEFVESVALVAIEVHVMVLLIPPTGRT